MDTSLTHYWLPRTDFSERHTLDVHASAAAIIAAVAQWKVEDDRLIRTAIMLRELPARLLQRARPHAMALTDFTLLEERPAEARLYGLIGAFWEADYGLCELATPAAFRQPIPGDVCKLILSFSLQPLNDADSAHRLITETHVHCTTPTAKRRFRPYWYLIRPVSGLIRRRMLTAIRQRAEATP